MATDIDTCFGPNGEHEVPAGSISAATQWTCSDCDALLNATIRSDREAARQSAHRSSGTCIAGGHAAGSKYYTCIACYGD